MVEKMHFWPWMSKHYSPKDYWKRKWPCKITICWKDLMSEDNIYLSKQIIEDKCICSKKDTCKMLVDLLSHGKIKEAEEILYNLNNNEE